MADILGWVKLHRKIRDSSIYSNHKALHCWIECLLRAQHEKNTFYQGREKVVLNPGQFLMGREEFGTSIGMSGSTAWYWIQQFEVDSMVDIKKTAKGSLVTILNWHEYQKVDSKVDNKKTANEQQMNTIKNVKNVKNDKNIYIGEKKFSPSPIREQWESFLRDTKDRQGIYLTIVKYYQGQGYDEKTISTQLQEFVMYWTEPTKSGKKMRWETEKTFEINRRLATWFKNYEKWGNKISTEFKPKFSI